MKLPILSLAVMLSCALQGAYAAEAAPSQGLTGKSALAAVTNFLLEEKKNFERGISSTLQKEAQALYKSHILGEGQTLLLAHANSFLMAEDRDLWLALRGIYSSSSTLSDKDKLQAFVDDLGYRVQALQRLYQDYYTNSSVMRITFINRVNTLLKKLNPAWKNSKKLDEVMDALVGAIQAIPENLPAAAESAPTFVERARAVVASAEDAGMEMMRNVLANMDRRVTHFLAPSRPSGPEPLPLLRDEEWNADLSPARVLADVAAWVENITTDENRKELKSAVGSVSWDTIRAGQTPEAECQRVANKLADRLRRAYNYNSASTVASAPFEDGRARARQVLLINDVGSFKADVVAHYNNLARYFGQSSIDSEVEYSEQLHMLVQLVRCVGSPA